MTPTSEAFDPAPRRLEDVLQPEWLSGMLGQRWPGVRVRTVEVVETLVTMATKVRIKLELEGQATGVPTELCIKGVLSETGAPASASITETHFYRDAAAGLGLNVPGCVYAGLTDTGDNGVVVMHDVVAAGGRFCSAVDPFTPDEARDGLDQLARLHVAGAAETPAYASAWAPRFLDQITAAPIIPREMLQGLLDGDRGVGLSSSVRDAAALQKGLEGLAEQARRLPNCLVHGDAHAGNIYRDAAGQLGIVDWQILQKGEWAQDVAYHLATVLTPADRRAHERDLLAYYCERLKALGGPDLDADAAWARYRAGMVYGYFLWAITRKVDPVITNTFVNRLGLAVDDLEGFRAVAT